VKVPFGINLNISNVNNGDITVSDVAGTLRVTYPIGLSGDSQFKSLNGEFFTDFQNVEILPAKVIKTTGNSGEIEVENIKGELEVNNVNGAIKLTNISGSAVATTLNGNIYVRKAK
jgi:DUF4097 and DUF4098 domain-containing protein YvlB